MFSSAHIPHSRPRPQSNPDNAKLHANATHMATMLSELEQMNEQRISPQQLRDKFGVVTEKLDIQTGKPKLGEPFLEPVQSDQVRDWIAEFQPEKEERLEMHPFEFADPNRAHLNELDPSGESIAMKEKIFNYVQCSRDWKRGYILEKQTLWRSFMTKSWPHLHRRDSINDWQVSEVFSVADSSQSDPMLEKFLPHPRFPHVQAWLHDALPVANDLSLTVAELSTVLTLALIVIRRSVYRQALIMPITVFSCSDRRLRIVQGGINFQKRSIDIRISEVVDFSSGGLCTTLQNKAKLYKILGWICATPVGRVMP